MAMIDSFKANIREHKLLNIGDTVIVGASGGPDSQLLIYMLNQIKDEYRLEIILAHLNHLHREEAVNDENLVKATGQRLGLEVKVRHRSMDEYAKELKISPEDAGRRLRYEFFNELAKDYEGAKIAIAHNLDDQAETMLIRMIRGTGPRGLAGMDFRNDNIIRPILNFKKSEILSYLDQNQIAYAIDATNNSNDYTRNYIRNEIIPKMESINPKLKDNLFNLSELVKDDLDIIDNEVKKTFDDLANFVEDAVIFDRDKFEHQDKSMQSQLMRFAINLLLGHTKDFSKTNIEDFIYLINLDNGKKIIKDKLEFIKTYNSYELRIIKDSENNEAFNNELESYLGLEDTIVFGNKVLISTEVDEKTNSSKNIGYFDMAKISFPLKIRSRENGDRFMPLGMNHNKKIKDFFIDEKVDKTLRGQVPLVLSNDEIIWVAGFRQSEKFKVTADTKKILKLEVRNDK